MSRRPDRAHERVRLAMCRLPAADLESLRWVLSHLDHELSVDVSGVVQVSKPTRDDFRRRAARGRYALRAILPDAPANRTPP